MSLMKGTAQGSTEVGSGEDSCLSEQDEAYEQPLDHNDVCLLSEQGRTDWSYIPPFLNLPSLQKKELSPWGHLALGSQPALFLL